jgi:hypothetical protein
MIIYSERILFISGEDAFQLRRGSFSSQEKILFTSGEDPFHLMMRILLAL